jgi:hypothetical protein
MACTASVGAGAAEDAGTTPVADRRAADEATLARREAELAARYRELERSLLRLADVLSGTDPRRADLLREAFDRARDEQVGDRLETIVKLLEQGQFLKAGTGQQEAIERFQSLLDLLEAGGGDRRLGDTRREVREYLARIAKLIARQRDIEGSTEGAGADADLAKRQDGTARDTGELAGELGRFARRLVDDARDATPATPSGDAPQPGSEPQPEGDAQSGGEPQPGATPADGADPDPTAAPPAEEPASKEADAPVEGDDDASRAARTRQRLEAAGRHMQAARERLEQARRREARADQEKALEDLETARAELEQILRQMREREIERLLVQLETRIRGMLKAERTVAAGVEKLAAASGQSERERQIEATRLSREQAAVAADAAKALTLLRDDGSAVAIPQALEQVRDDASEAAARLGRSGADGPTLGLIGDIVTGLEELLAALEKAHREAEAPQAGPAGGRTSQAGEQPLVDKLAELKMIRALQVRVNTRTDRLARLLGDSSERAVEPGLRGTLERLAERQRAIERAARDIVSGLAED